MSSHPTAPPQAPNPNHAQWFTEEVHPHERSLKTYLRQCFPSMRDVDDVVQESYVRIWKVRATRPIRSAKAFLFSIARHIALDLHRRDRARPTSAVGDLSSYCVLEDRPGAVETASLHEKMDLLAEALATLPPRCREITVLRRLKGMSQREIAERFGISERTVEEQVYRGTKRSQEYVRKHGGIELFRT